MAEHRIKFADLVESHRHWPVYRLHFENPEHPAVYATLLARFNDGRMVLRFDEQFFGDPRITFALVDEYGTVTPQIPKDGQDFKLFPRTIEP